MPCSRCGCAEVDHDGARGASYCSYCGLVLEENQIISQISFAESTSGRSSVIGTFVPTGGPRKSYKGSSYRDSREASLDNARRLIQTLASSLRLNQHQVEAAQSLFKLALHHNFSRGRRSQNVIASCVYIVCRREKTPHLLIDFSDILQTNVYVLGQTFLSFCRLLNLHLPIIDPSLYIPRFAAKLEFEDKTTIVANTAIRLVARMKRDWIQTGRRPSGICGAGLLIAARLHGFRRTQKEIIQVVRICDTTLRRRLAEFQETPSAHLTPEEFELIDLDEECNPPAFTRARQKDPKPSEGGEGGEVSEGGVDEIDSPELGMELDNEQLERAIEDTLNSDEFKAIEKDFSRKSATSETTSATTSATSSTSSTSGNTSPQRVPIQTTPSPASRATLEHDGEDVVEDEGEDLSDITDADVAGYIHNPDEVKLKTALWHAMNKDYLEQQAEKEKEEASNRAAGKQPKKRKRENKKGTPESAAEATMAVLKKKVSAKINYNAVKNLFEREQMSAGVNEPTSRFRSRQQHRGFDDQETAAVTAGLHQISEAFENLYQHFEDDGGGDDDPYRDD